MERIWAAQKKAASALAKLDVEIEALRREPATPEEAATQEKRRRELQDHLQRVEEHARAALARLQTLLEESCAQTDSCINRTIH